jgi:resuscitation-promoting factor RpfA
VTAALRSALRLAAWVAGLLVVGRVAYALGSDELHVPLTSVDDFSAWVRDAAPGTMAMAVLRLGVLAGVGYLLVATALATVAEIVHIRPLSALADLVTPGLVQRIAQGGGGLGLALGAAVGSVPAPDLGPPAPPTAIVAPDNGRVATMTRAPDTGDTGGIVASMTSVADVPAVTATMTRTDASAPGPSPPAPAPPPEPAPAPADGATWVVEPGDSLWSIAADAVGGGDERAVGRYWRRLIDVNRPRLVDPANPDLLVPGQELEVPPP